MYASIVVIETNLISVTIVVRYACDYPTANVYWVSFDIMCYIAVILYL